MAVYRLTVIRNLNLYYENHHPPFHFYIVVLHGRCILCTAGKKTKEKHEQRNKRSRA
jgi:hypothetical protein